MRLPDTLHIPEQVLDIARRLEAAGFEAWCVGGAIRDALLGNPESDYDIATSAKPEQVQRVFRRTIPVGIEFGTVGVLDENKQVHEVTTFRRDVSTDGRRAVVAYGVTLEEDLSRRDFTINAIAYHPLRHEWRDPFNGVADLEGKVVRAVGEAQARFREDYLRILRGLRFAARFDFAIDQGTWESAVATADGLTGLSAERVRDEWFKGLETAQSLHRLVQLWRDSGAATRMLPELIGPPDAETIWALRAPRGEVPRDPVLLTVLLCRRPAEVLERLRCSNSIIRRAAGIDHGPRQPEGADAVSVRHWLSAVGPVAGDNAELARLRDGKAPPWWTVAEEVLQRGDPLTRKDLKIGGEDLLAAGVPAGPRLGEVLERLLRVVLDDPSKNTREALLALAKEMT